MCVCVYSPPLFIYPQTPALVTATQFPYIICNVQTNIIEHHRRNGKKVARTNEKPSPQNEKLELAIEAPEEEKNTSSTTSEAPVKKSVENCLKFLDCVGHKFREQSENNIILYVEMQKATSTMELNDREEENIAKMKTGKK